MKILFIGDTHFNDRRPENRTDESYIDTQIGKLDQIHQIARAEGCRYIFQTGDFFDSSTVSDRTMSRLIDFLIAAQMHIYCIWGQHDLTGHSAQTLSNSPLNVLHSAGVVTIIDHPDRDSNYIDISECRVYGASFGKLVPEPVDVGVPSILIVHDMIADRKLFPGHEPISPKTFLKANSGFTLIVCGDWHYSFIGEYQGRQCINPGALVRKTISENDLAHEPSVMIFDSKTGKVTQRYLDVASVDEVFNLNTKNKVDKHNVLLDKFLEDFRNKETSGVSWRKILADLFKQENVNIDIRDIIEDSIEICCG